MQDNLKEHKVPQVPKGFKAFWVLKGLKEFKVHKEPKVSKEVKGLKEE